MTLTIHFENGAEITINNCDEDVQRGIANGLSVAKGEKSLLINKDKVLYTVMAQD